MALAFLYAGDGISKFIPEPTDILSETKDRLQLIVDGLINSIDHSYSPKSLTSALENHSKAMQQGTRGKEPDLTSKILELL